MVDRLTPADVSPFAASYTGDPNDAGFTSLHRAKRIRQGIAIQHRDAQTNLKRQAEDDKTKYGDALEVINFNIAESEQLQTTVLEGGTVWPGLYSVLFGAGGVLCGRNFLKRPGDLSPDEVEA